MKVAVLLSLVGSLLLSGQAAADDSPPPTFSRDIAPIVYRHCATCHHPGPNGAFSLITYEDARPRAAAMAAATRSRYMPPWKPEAGYSDELIGRRGLNEREIETIQRWAASGAARGDSADAPAASLRADGWRLGTPDLVIQMPEAYDVPARGPDIFRIFAFAIPNDRLRYVKAIEFLPGSRAVHHANLRLDETSNSRDLDRLDPAPGYDGLLARTAHFPDGHFFGWTPGQLPPPSEELAWPLNPGTDMVLQLHLKPTGAPERVRSAIGLYFAAGPPRLTPVMLRLGKQDLDIAAGQRDFETTDSYVLPVDVVVHGVQPHAHYRAKEIQGFATLPDGSRKWLLYIRDWDFDWQDTYRYVKPFTLPKGAKLTMRFTYDNSSANRRNPTLPPERVYWGQRSSDEMGDLWIQVVPRTPEDVNVLTREFRQKVFLEDIVGYETVLKRTPDDVGLHDDVALLDMAVGRIDAAIAHFAESARLSPAVAVTHFNLGTALAAGGRAAAASEEFRRALGLAPNYASAHNNLGALLLASRQYGDAKAHFERAIEIDPGYAEAHNNLGRLFAETGRLDQALAELSRALQIKDGYAQAHYNLASVLVSLGRAREAVGHYRSTLSLLPEWRPALSDLAWLLATHPDAQVRDARGSVPLAEQFVALAGRDDVSALDVLSAAYAADGRFDDAAATARAAIEIATGRRATAAAGELAQRLALYRQRQGYIDTHHTGPVRP